MNIRPISREIQEGSIRLDFPSGVTVEEVRGAMELLGGDFLTLIAQVLTAQEVDPDPETCQEVLQDAIAEVFAHPATWSVRDQNFQRRFEMLLAEICGKQGKFGN